MSLCQYSLPLDEPTDTLQAQFVRYHARHPEVYRLFCDLAEQMRATGRRRYSARTILHVIRWHRALESDPREDEGFKINNNYSSRYARMLITERPEFEGFFSLRELRTE